MKVKEKQIQKIIPKQIKKLENNKKSKPLEKRKNHIKKKLQISNLKDKYIYYILK